MPEPASAKPQHHRGERRAVSGPTDGARHEQEPDVLQPTPDARKPITESRMNRIARRAHELYEARGGEHGRALEDWLQAEREIDSEPAGERGSDANSLQQ